MSRKASIITPEQMEEMGFLHFLQEQPKSTEKKADGDQTPSENETNSKSKKVKPPIVVKSVRELPQDYLKLLSKNKIELSWVVDENFDALLNILRFLTKQPFKNPDDEKQVKERLQSVSSAMLIKTEQSLSELENPKKLFKHTEFSGKGGFGRVFFAQRTEDKAKVAIKKMEHSTESQVLSNLSEIATLRACAHPNIVSFINAYKVKQELWLITEYMEGGTLEQALKSHHFTEGQIGYVCREILQGLKFLHSKNFAHRDIKSANVMMTIDGDIKLIDFGLCIDASRGNPSQMVGSAFWMSPEMIKRQPYTTKVDMWSLGVVILEMLDGRVPYHDSSLKAMYMVATLGLQNQIKESVSEDLQDFIRRCFVMNPEERSSASELLEHKYLVKSEERSSLQDILRAVFLHQTIQKGGFFQFAFTKVVLV